MYGGTLSFDVPICPVEAYTLNDERSFGIMDDVTANPNDSSSLSMDTPSCVANCPLKSKYKEVAAALGERDFNIALLYYTLMRVTGPEKIEGEEAAGEDRSCARRQGKLCT